MVSGISSKSFKSSKLRAGSFTDWTCCSCTSHRCFDWFEILGEPCWHCKLFVTHPSWIFQFSALQGALSWQKSSLHTVMDWWTMFRYYGRGKQHTHGCPHNFMRPDYLLLLFHGLFLTQSGVRLGTDSLCSPVMNYVLLNIIARIRYLTGPHVSAFTSHMY